MLELRRLLVAAAELGREGCEDRAERAGRTSAAKLKAMRFASEGREMCLAVLRTQAGAERDTKILDEIASAVLRILGEAQDAVRSRRVA